MRKRHYFFNDCARYAFDFKLCTTAKGYAQVDTNSDAWYYGNWVCPSRLTMVAYVEGDVYVTRCADENEFRDEFSALLGSLDASSGLKGIDCGLHEAGVAIARRLEELGFDGSAMPGAGISEYWVSPKPPRRLNDEREIEL